MFKIWCKTYTEDKITRDCIYEQSGVLDTASFELTLREICHGFDIPTPMILTKHINSIMQFNMVKFLPEDFVESIDFDYFMVESF